MSGGTFLRGEDGSLYFVRDEILEACKVEGEHLENATKVLDEEGEVEGFAFSSTTLATVQPIRHVDTSLIARPGTQIPNLDLGSYSTVMCPW